MNMHMRYCLARRRSIIDTDVIRRRVKLAIKLALGQLQQFQQALPLTLGGFEEGGNMAFGND
jgi:hypothetical protein